MSIYITQKSIGTTLGTLVTVPAGVNGIVLNNPIGTNTVYIGNGTNTSTLNGFPIVGASVPVLIPGFVASGGTTLYAISTAVNTVVGVIISSAESGTGL